MKETVYMTMKVFDNAGSHLVYLSDHLGIDVGDMVALTFYKMGDCDRKIMKLTKRVVKVGNGRGCYIDKRLGVIRGDVIIARIDPAGVAGEKSDARIKAEKGFEEPFE